MGGLGYEMVAQLGAAVAQANGNGWILPDPSPDPSAGWFYTTEAGKLSGGGTPGADCAELFRYSSAAYSDAVIWTPPMYDSWVPAPIPGTHIVEGARAQCFGRIDWFELSIEVPRSTYGPLESIIRWIFGLIRRIFRL
jgi:hypothetical protein